MDKMTFLEYNPIKKTFHILYLEQMLSSNLNWIENPAADYWIPVACGEHEEMSNLGLKMRKEIDFRDLQKTKGYAQRDN